MKKKAYSVQTFDETGYFTFVTMATNSKQALNIMLRRSSDFKNIVHADKKLIITITPSK